MAIGKITLRLVNVFSAQAQRQEKALYLWDSELAGFGCHIFPSGKISWLHQHWEGGRGGRPRRIVFGSLPSMNVSQARTRAQKLRVQIDDGIDVLSRKAERLQLQRASLAAPTVSEAVEQYLTGKPTDDDKYWRGTKATFDNSVNPAIGAIKLKEVTRADVRKLIDEKLDASLDGAARASHAALSAFFGFCVRRDLIVKSPMEGLLCPPATRRDRILTDQEITAFSFAASDIGYPFGPIYQLLLLTGQRRNEVSGMAWSEVDLDTGLWTIPSARTKNGKIHIVHLPPQAVSVLVAMRRNDMSGLVFTTTGKTSVSGFSKSKKSIDKRMPEGTPHWRIHDLRRTAASGMARLGVLPNVIERVLNHQSGVNGGLVGIYQRYEYMNERRDALEAWGQYVHAICVQKPS